MAPLGSYATKFVRAAFTASAAGRRCGIAKTEQYNQQQQQMMLMSPSSSAASPAGVVANNDLSFSSSSSSAESLLSSFCLSKMCTLFDVEPADNLYLHCGGGADGDGGERGVRVRRMVERGDVVLSIPLKSCFRDDEPPRWHGGGDDVDEEEGEGEEGMERDITDYERYSPSAWASRLAASVLDATLLLDNDDNDNNNDNDSIDDDDLVAGRRIWRSMLPDRDVLRASLPVHWDEDVLRSSKCTALELAVDSAYFARANAVAGLAEELRGAAAMRGGGEEGEERRLRRECDDDFALDVAQDVGALQRKCHDALDIVQTRACRVERRCEDTGAQWGPPLRVVAPVFDFINHGVGTRSANAAFGIENGGMCDLHDARLVVRASRDIKGGEEVLVDYGDSARPAWRCLTSYGFVPEYDYDDDGDADDVDDDDDVGDHRVEDVAELWMNGRRFEVDPLSVPFDLVEEVASSASDRAPPSNDISDDEEGDGAAALTPAVARAIARRATEAAFHLVADEHDGDYDDAEEDDGAEWDDPEFVRASSLASMLRWSQHRVLLAFAENLEAFVAESELGEGA